AGGVLVIGGIEAWKVLRDPLGLRLGDSWASTQVTDGKVVAGAAELSEPPSIVRAPGQLRELSDRGGMSGGGNRCAAPGPSTGGCATARRRRSSTARKRSTRWRAPSSGSVTAWNDSKFPGRPREPCPGSRRTRRT